MSPKLPSGSSTSASYVTLPLLLAEVRFGDYNAELVQELLLQL